VPELPEVERYRLALEEHASAAPVVRAEVRKTYLLRTPPAELTKVLEGQSLEGTLRRGKELFVRFAPSQGWLRVHFGMDGDWAFSSTQEPLPKYAVLVLDFADGERVCYTSFRLLGRLEWVPDALGWIAAHGLGPDALDAPLAEVVAALEGKRGHAKAALLDQTCLAGVGNLYADEALFQAGLHPRAAVERLAPRERLALARTVQRVLRTAVAKEADFDRYPKGWLLHARGEGGRCPKDRTLLERSVVGGRTTYHCPEHQRLGAPKKGRGGGGGTPPQGGSRKSGARARP
jgi:formamidopyrimidine-DNA glycosylase